MNSQQGFFVFFLSFTPKICKQYNKILKITIYFIFLLYDVAGAETHIIFCFFYLALVPAPAKCDAGSDSGSD